jgi:beta-lactamase superfamily II metal-dependent hydrolase
MSYEIDFLPVGNGASSGDAIALRYGNLHGSRSEQTVVAIDGGTKDSGQKLVEHILTYYNTDVVDLVVCTHPDGDHASGLSVVVEKLTVKRLWMHRPWIHGGKIRDAFSDGRITNDSLSGRFQAALTYARRLEEIAIAKGIPITEPFSDGTASTQFPDLTVLGPSSDYYRELLPYFDCMPATKSVSESIFGRMAEAAKTVVESWGWETLTEPVEGTRPENNSSVILLLQVDGHNSLFTGDAGVPALEKAADFAEARGVNLQSCVFQQIPHHGSKRNVGPTILNRIVGAKGTPETGKVVYFSAAPDGAPKHPAKKVLNAYKRRGAKAYGTKGETKGHSYNAPVRLGWTAATPVPFYDEVDE